jgi:hypothetical protein
MPKPPESRPAEPGHLPHLKPGRKQAGLHGVNSGLRSASELDTALVRARFPPTELLHSIGIRFLVPLLFLVGIIVIAARRGLQMTLLVQDGVETTGTIVRKLTFSPCNWGRVRRIRYQYRDPSARPVPTARRSRTMSTGVARREVRFRSCTLNRSRTSAPRSIWSISPGRRWRSGHRARRRNGKRP